MRFFRPYSFSETKTEVNLNLSNYVTKSDIKNAKDADILQFTKKN